MKKILVSLLVVLLSVNVVFAEAIPPVPFTKGCSSIGGNYDCFINFIMYWFGFPKTKSVVNLFGIDVELEGRDAYYEAQKGATGFLTEIIIPLVALTLITFGFMFRLNIFGRRLDWINPVLSFLMVIVSAKIGIFRVLVGLVFTVGPAYAFVLWAILFFTGLWFIFKKAYYRGATEVGLHKTYYTQAKELEQEIKDIRKQKNEIMQRIAVETSDTAIDKLKAAYEVLNTRQGNIEARKKDLKDTYTG